MKDALASEEFNVGSLIAGVGSVTGLLESSESIAAGELEADSVTASEIAAGAVGASEQAFVGTGSPPGYYRKILGDSTAVVGSPALTGYIVFGDTFLAVPDTIIAKLDTGASELSQANVTTGSFEVTSVTAGVFSGNVQWIAMGSSA